MKKESQQLPPYSLRLEPEIRANLEAIAKANGRSLNAEIAMRLDESLLPRPKTEWKHMLDPAVYSLLEEAAREEGRSLHAEILLRLESSLLSSQRLDWKQILDPAVYSHVKSEAALWGLTLEEVIADKLSHACDKELSNLFLADLSDEVIVRRMKENTHVTIGQVLDERMINSAKKMRDNPEEKRSYYPFSGKKALESFMDFNYNYELFIRKIIHDELAKAGITPVEEPK